MNAGQQPNEPPPPGSSDQGAGYRVNIQQGPAVVGERNTQIIATYSTYYNIFPGTWTDGVGPPSLADSTSAMTESPYRGLAAFGEQDAGLFFGRDEATAQVLERMSRRLSQPGLLVLSGVSGAGKSSLLRAGVLPRIRDSGLAEAPQAAQWPWLVLTPGRDPLAALAGVAALAGLDVAANHQTLKADPSDFALTVRQVADFQPAGAEQPGHAVAGRGRRLLLVVDQFEQLFTQCPDEDQRMAFLTALHAAATAGRGADDQPAALAVLVVRADFEARCADYQLLAEAVQDRYLVTAMTERQLRMAITEPARKAGSHADADLVTVLLGDIRSRAPGMAALEPGPGMTAPAGILPLLSHVLDTAWRARAGGSLTVADYEHTGGIERAVADSAERAYTQLTPGQQAAARTIFLRLTATSPDGTITADRATRVELLHGKDATQARDVEAVLEAFAAERLLALAAGTVEISHEVLLRAWPLLRDKWLADTLADRIVRTRLRAAAGEWDRSGRDPSYLYAGSLLQDATATVAGAARTRQPEPSRVEQEFLYASSRARRRVAGVRRAALAALLSLTTGLAVATVAAYSASQNADHASRVAARQRDDAIASQLVTESEAQADTNPAASRIESLAAWQLDPTTQSRYALISAATSPAIAVLTGRTGYVNSVAFSPDGQTLATSGDDGTVLWDVATRRQIGQLTESQPISQLMDTGAYEVAFSPDGQTLATSGTHGTARLWDVSTRQQIGQPLPGGTSSLAFNPNGRTLATAAGNELKLWNVSTRQQIGQPLTAATANDTVDSEAFSPGGQTLATGSKDGTVRLWNAATRQQIGLPLTADGGVYSVAFSPDGRTLATDSLEGTVQLWDVATRRPVGQPLTASSVNAVAFSPGGQTLATGSNDGTVRLWDVATQQQIGQTITAGTSVNAVAFSPDGQTLATGNPDGTVRLWDVAWLTGLLLTADSVGSVAFSPDGQTLATVTGNADGTVQLWDVATRRPIGPPLTAGTFVDAVAFSPDGQTLATVTRTDGAVQLWDVATRRPIGQPLKVSPPSIVDAVAFSPDGRALAVSSLGGTVRLWDVATRQEIGPPLTIGTFGATVDVVALSQDGRTLATGDADGTGQLWDVQTHRQIGQTITTASTSSGVAEVAFSPDGQTLATASDNGTVQLWDVPTQQQTGQTITYPGTVDAVAFSPDGRTLAIGGGNRTVQLWDVAAQQQIGQTLTASTTRPVNSVAFSPDGQILAADNWDGTVRLWNVNAIGHALTQVCDQIGGSVTPAEWRQYVPAGPAYNKVCP